MKLSDFTNKNTDFRPQSTQVLAFNNEAKEAELASKIAFLEQKTSTMEQIADEKVILSGQLETKSQENSRLIQENAVFEQKVSTLEAQIQEKERFLGDLDSFKQQNSQLLLDHGEMMTRMSTLRFDSDRMYTELEQLRTNNADLETTRFSLENTVLNKETLINELTTTMTDVKEQYEGLVGSTEQLTKGYAELAEANQKLDNTNLQLVSQAALLERRQQESEQVHKKEKEVYGKAIEERAVGSMNKQIVELQQDVEELININKYYKSELSKPQHMSIGAIARQEQFKLPLASSAINYRTNNLGTAQPTLLKFSSREVTNDH